MNKYSSAIFTQGTAFGLLQRYTKSLIHLPNVRQSILLRFVTFHNNA